MTRMSDTYTKPERRLLPTPSPDSTAFWTGGREGRLLIHKCGACGHYFHPPAPACWRCRSTDVGPQPASGLGKVASFTINRQPWIPGMPPPYVVAIIELDDEPDVRLMSNVVGLDVDAVRTGMAVQVFFEDWGDVSIPLFRPVEASA